MEARRQRLALLTARNATATSGAPGKHEIAEIEAFALREPVSRRAYTLVRIRTRSGLTGYGECSATSRSDLERFRQILVGRAATAYVGAAMGSSTDAAVTGALLDIVARACAAPLYRVLGGPTRHKIRVMTSLEGSTDAQLVTSLSLGLKSGFRAFRVPVPTAGAKNQGQAYVQAVRSRLEGLRSVAGDTVDFVLDAGGKLSPGDATSIAADLEEFHLLWFDEPCSASNPERVQRIAEQTVTPMGFGRSLPNPAAFQDLLRIGIMDVACPDLSREGILNSRRIAALAETYYVAVAPNHEGGPVGTAAAIHLAASLPNFFIQHIPLPTAEADRSMRSELLSHPIEEVQGGYVAFPDGPGLGAAVNERALEKYKDSQ